MGWPPFLADESTRASHIAILVGVSLLFIGAIVLIIWVAFRNTDSLAVTLTQNAEYEVLDTALTGPKQEGLHWIGPNQCIQSSDGNWTLRLTNRGVAQLVDNRTDTIVYSTPTENTASPGTRFLMGVDGYCYLIRDDGSRLLVQGASPDTFYRSPNQRDPISKDEKTGQTFNAGSRFRLSFFEQGMVMSSVNLREQTLSNLWWEPRNVTPPS